MSLAPTSENETPLVRFEAVSKRFSDQLAVDRVSLDIREGEFFALLGASGCGKTTLLRLLAGLEDPSAGRVLLDGADLARVPPHRRPVNMMFQSYALFPHLSVAGNIGFGLKMAGLAKTEIADRVEEMLALVRLEGFAGRRPDQLSGGQQQRVALARALARRPKVLLLDEPMAALDRKLRNETGAELKALRARLGLTFIIVTHDQDEAMTLADRVAVMDQGRIVQTGAPAQVYENPNSRQVAAFLGEVNLFEAVVGAYAPPMATLASGEFPGGLSARTASCPDPGATVWLAVRPEKMRMTPTPPKDAMNVVQGTICDVGYRGDWTTYEVEIAPGRRLRAARANLTRGQATHGVQGQSVWLGFAPEAGVVLSR